MKIQIRVCFSLAKELKRESRTAQKYKNDKSACRRLWRPVSSKQKTNETSFIQEIDKIAKINMKCKVITYSLTYDIEEEKDVRRA